MNSEEVARLEVRLTKAMGEMEARLTNAIHQVALICPETMPT